MILKKVFIPKKRIKDKTNFYTFYDMFKEKYINILKSKDKKLKSKTIVMDQWKKL